MTMTEKYNVKRTDWHGRSGLVMAYPDDAGIPLEMGSRTEADEYVAGANRRALIRGTNAIYEAVPVSDAT